MARNPTGADRLRVLERRKRVAELYMRGHSQWEIARRVDCTQSTVSLDLVEIRKMWIESAAMDFHARQAQELAKIDRLEIIAEKAWRRSCQDAEIRYSGKTTGRTTNNGTPLPDLEKEYVTVKGQAGDPRFLERIAWCIEERTKILGILAALKVHLGGDKNAPPVETTVNGDVTVVLTGEVMERLNEFTDVYDQLASRPVPLLTNPVCNGVQEQVDTDESSETEP